MYTYFYELIKKLQTEKENNKTPEKEAKQCMSVKTQMYPPLQTADHLTPSDQHNSGKRMYFGPKGQLLYMVGETQHKDKVNQNCDTTPEVKKSLSQGYPNHNLVLRERPDPNYTPSDLTVEDLKLWAQFKHLLTDPYLCPLMADDLCDILPQNPCGKGFVSDDGLMLAGNEVTYHHKKTGYRSIVTESHHDPEGQMQKVIFRDINSKL